MPTAQNTINLIQSKHVDVNPQTEAIERSLQKSGIYAMIGFFCVSVVVAMVYSLFSLQLKNQKIEQSKLYQQINSMKTKEGYLLAIKDRTQTVQKAMENQKPWAKMLDLVATFAAPPALRSISVDEQDKIVLSIKTFSLEEILQIVDMISDYVDQGQIKNPQLLSFQIAKEGEFQISVSFNAVFDEI